MTHNLPLLLRVDVQAREASAVSLRSSPVPGSQQPRVRARQPAAGEGGRGSVTGRLRVDSPAYAIAFSGDPGYAMPPATYVESATMVIVGLKPDDVGKSAPSVA